MQTTIPDAGKSLLLRHTRRGSAINGLAVPRRPTSPDPAPRGPGNRLLIASAGAHAAALLVFFLLPRGMPPGSEPIAVTMSFDGSGSPGAASGAAPLEPALSTPPLMLPAALPEVSEQVSPPSPAAPAAPQPVLEPTQPEVAALPPEPAFQPSLMPLVPPAATAELLPAIPRQPELASVPSPPPIGPPKPQALPPHAARAPAPPAANRAPSPARLRTLPSEAPAQEATGGPPSPPRLGSDRQDTVPGAAATASASAAPLLITNPRFRAPPAAPAYPSLAREQGEEGEVIVRVRLDRHGDAEQVVLHASSGHLMLDRAALAAVRGWAFEPGRRNGEAVPAWVQIPVRFALR